MSLSIEKDGPQIIVSLSWKGSAKSEQFFVPLLAVELAVLLHTKILDYPRARGLPARRPLMCVLLLCVTPLFGFWLGNNSEERYCSEEWKK